MLATKKGSSIIVAVIFIFIALALSGGLFYILQKEQVKNKSLQQQLEDITARQLAAESKLEESRKTVASLEGRLKDAQLKADTLAIEIENEKTARQQALSEVASLKQSLDEQAALRQEIEDKLKSAQAEISKSQAQMVQLETKKIELESRIKELEIKSSDLEAKVKGIELGTIVVSPQEKKKAQKAVKEKKVAKKTQKKEKQATKAGPVAESKAAQPQEPSAQQNRSPEGSILVVNKEYNFAVINLGTNEGVKQDAVFSVFRKDKYLGDIKVEKVHESMSAAGFVTDGLIDKIAEGDKVAFKK